MLSVFASSALDRGFKSWIDLTKQKNIHIQQGWHLEVWGSIGNN